MNKIVKRILKKALDKQLDKHSQELSQKAAQKAAAMLPAAAKPLREKAEPVLEKAIRGEHPGEIESLFFCLQTGIGVGIIAYVMGRFIERKKLEKAGYINKT